MGIFSFLGNGCQLNTLSGVIFVSAMAEAIVNKVAQSGLITLDLATLYPKEAVMGFDLKPFLFMEMILKEKDFREQLKLHDWNMFDGAHAAVFCSADAIIPVWAYMLVATYLQPVAVSVRMGTPDEVKTDLLLENVDSMQLDEFADQRIVVKGCGEIPIDDKAYLAVTAKIAPVARSIMYGEPCSTVPIFKRKG